jgi:hypothetical protein
VRCLSTNRGPLARKHAPTRGVNARGKLYRSCPRRGLALHMHYRDWVQIAQVDPEITADVTLGRVPVISWRCGDDAPPNSASFER